MEYNVGQLDTTWLKSIEMQVEVSQGVDGRNNPSQTEYVDLGELNIGRSILKCWR